MKLAFTNDVGTSQFYWPSLMDETSYRPPGISVYEADDGTRWFRVRQTLGKEMLETRDDVVRYDPDSDSDNEEDS